jgi:hypothetical protein
MSTRTANAINITLFPIVTQQQDWNSHYIICGWDNIHILFIDFLFPRFVGSSRSINHHNHNNEIILTISFPFGVVSLVDLATATATATATAIVTASASILIGFESKEVESRSP